jgi:hypothetical protein
VKNQDFSEVLIAFIKSLAIFKVKWVFQGAPISYFQSFMGSSSRPRGWCFLMAQNVDLALSL